MLFLAVGFGRLVASSICATSSFVNWYPVGIFSLCSSSTACFSVIGIVVFASLTNLSICTWCLLKMSDTSLCSPGTCTMVQLYLDNSSENLSSIPAESLHSLRKHIALASTRMMMSSANLRKKSMVLSV